MKMIGSYIDLTTEEALLSALPRSPVLSTFYQNQIQFSNYISLKNGILVFWCSKSASSKRTQRTKGKILLYQPRTNRILKKFPIRQNVTKIFQSYISTELILLTDEGLLTINCSNGFSLSPLQKFPGIHSIMPIPQSEAILIFKREPIFSMSYYGCRGQPERTILEYVAPGELISEPILLESYKFLVFMAEVEDYDNRSRFKKGQDSILFAVYDYSTNKQIYKTVQKFSGIIIKRLYQYTPSDNTVLLEYVRPSQCEHFLSLWNVQTSKFVETRRFAIDYYTSGGPRSLFLAASRNLEKMFLLMEVSKLKHVQAKFECECHCTAFVTMNINTFQIESCAVISNPRVKSEIENIKYYDENSQAFVSIVKGALSIIDSRVLQKRSFEKALTVAEFDKWVKDSDIPAKIMKIFITDDTEY